MKIKKITISLIILLMCALLVGVGDTVYATGGNTVNQEDLPEAVKKKQIAAVKLVVYATDESQKKYNIRQGTGILVEMKSDSSQSPEMVLTNDKLIRVDEEEWNDIRLKYGISPEAGLNIHVDVVLQVGTRIQTEAKHSGDGFVVLNLSTDISEIECMNLGDSSALNMNDKLYMLGYGGNKNILGQDTLSDLTLSPRMGVVSSLEDGKIVTDFEPQSGDIGMPVVNANGYVVGMLVEDGDAFYIKPIDEIKKALDVLNISYVGIEQDNHYNEVTEEVRKELDTLLFECQELAMDTDTYSEKSINKLKEAITVAMQVKAEPSSTYDQYKAAIEGLQKNKDKLKKKDHSVHMLQIGLAVAILMILILSFRMQRQINHMQSENRYNLGGVGSAGDVVYAKLIRLDTLQEIAISNVIFKIGKCAEDVDYVIENNTSVSRHHADIMRKGKEFFILDNNSTNHTFVNGEQIISGQYVPLRAGDKVRLSDVEFQFEI